MLTSEIHNLLSRRCLFAFQKTGFDKEIYRAKDAGESMDIFSNTATSRAGDDAKKNIFDVTIYNN